MLCVTAPVRHRRECVWSSGVYVYQAAHAYTQPQNSATDHAYIGILGSRAHILSSALFLTYSLRLCVRLYMSLQSFAYQYHFGISYYDCGMSHRQRIH